MPEQACEVLDRFRESFRELNTAFIEAVRPLNLSDSQIQEVKILDVVCGRKLSRSAVEVARHLDECKGCSIHFRTKVIQLSKTVSL